MKKAMWQFKNSIKGKLILPMCLAVLIIDVIVFCIFLPLGSRWLVHSLEERFTAAIDNLQSMNLSRLEMEQLGKLGYRIHFMTEEELDGLNLTLEQKEELNRTGRLISLSGRSKNWVIAAKTGSQYAIYPTESYIMMIESGMKAVFWSLTVSFGACALAIIFTVRKVTKPVAELAVAANKIAEGDFDVYIENDGQDEMARLTRRFNHMASELKQTEYMQKDFLDSMSHEFKTPISAIKGFATILQNGGIPEEDKQEYLGIILDESNRLSELATNILNLSRLENMERIEKSESFYLDEQLRKTIVILERQWSRKKITFEVELESVEYTGKSESLMQVWINIIGNAIKFSPEKSIIRIFLEHHGGGARIIVEDHGCGMDENTRKHIFDRFYQKDQAGTDGGIGLGLSIAKRIVDLSGGQILAESEPGRGSRFIVELP
ncbi:HAMP domain-containing sensor histidine kinase [Anaerolentibacter hominis]|uniref:HAMP domain-containing sensor histidine kinase n=1 Tax=Anaerolentibacter hominis TaxID=3079009 RepID=UPI0031B83FFB